MKPEIERILGACTSHLTRGEAFTELSILNRSTLSRDEGFLIHTRLDEAAEPDQLERWGEEKNISNTAKEVFKLARELNCEWVLFDRDGPELDGIGTYDW